MEPIISVIVPIYNINDYIGECVQSICTQTYNNLEIILVDDGSIDGSAKICDKYRLQDARIKVIHKVNGGLSDARNVALDICKGEYISFIDGDDVVSSDYIEKLYRLIVSTDSQIAICGHKDFYKLPIVDAIQTDAFFEFSPDDAIKEILTNGRFTTSAWGKLYKRDFFEEIRYPKGKLFEDLPTTWQTFDLAQKIVFTPSQEYYYRQNPTSIMNSKFNPKKLDIISAHDSLTEGLKKRRPNLVKYAHERAGTYASMQLYSAIMSGYTVSTDLKQLRTVIRKYLKELIDGSYPFRIKLFSLIAVFPGFLELTVFINKRRNK